jgi:hypothetical protein
VELASHTRSLIEGPPLKRSVGRNRKRFFLVAKQDVVLPVV